jgi:hypothetical protein
MNVICKYDEPIKIWDFGEQISLKEDSVTVMVIDHEGEYTLCLTEKGGPIIRGKNLEETKIKFREALDLSITIKNLMNYNEKHHRYSE